MRKTSLRLLAVLGLAAGLAACDARDADFDPQPDSNVSSTDVDPIFEESDGTVGTSGMQDHAGTSHAGMEGSFAQFAATSNKAEIELGRLAERKAQNPAVKEYAARLVSDHTKALQELKKAASMTEDPQLDAKHKETYERLSKLSGEAFDREFVAVMLQDHQKAVDRFQMQARSGGEAADAPRATGTAGRETAASERSLSEYAEKTLPTLRGHLETAKRLQASR